MSILGIDGAPLTSADDVQEYKVGDFGFSTQKPPAFFLQIAAATASRTLQQVVQNPFQLEPAAQGAFMLISEVLRKQEERIAELEAKLEGATKGAPNEHDS